ncbi:unnamed protein product [Prorocentrum cordatum]|uniref:Major facilitator superfamily (MFS) profile domain-containing protein n=1 Tax=Prorocentrum cordatum TaxID=2364126 RepID=A0ABN9QMH4_9DINO|nr:unnamed protein product [Polarella glacialis]
MALFQRGISFFHQFAKPELKLVPLEERSKQNAAPELPERPAHRGVLLGSLMSFISVTAFAIGIPFLQTRRDALGCDALCQGGQTSLRSALNLVGASLIGRASDQFGRLPMLWLGLVSSLATFGITYSINTLQGMWIAIVPSGLLDHRWNVAKALLTDYTTERCGDDADRAGAVGKLGMAVGMSFMAGPMIGTLVVTTHEEALTLSMVLTICSGLFIAMLPVPARQVQHQTKSSSGMMDFMRMPVLRTRGAQLLIGVRFLMALAFHMFAPVWQVSLKARFDFGPRDHAQFMGMVGFCYALSQGVVSKPLIKLAGRDPSRLILLCIIALGGCRPFALWTTSVAVVYMLYVPMFIALGVLNTAITTACSCLADGDQLGGFFGVMESVESIAGMVGPTIGGLAAARHADLPLAAVCSSYAAAFVLVLLFFGRHVAQITPDAPTGSKKDQ